MTQRHTGWLVGYRQVTEWSKSEQGKRQGGVGTWWRVKSQC